MTSNIALFSVLFLAVIVAVAFWRKCNIGILDKLCTDAGYSASDFAIPSMVNLILWFCLLMVIIKSGKSSLPCRPLLPLLPSLRR